MRKNKLQQVFDTLPEDVDLDALLEGSTCSRRSRWLRKNLPKGRAFPMRTSRSISNHGSNNLGA